MAIQSSGAISLQDIEDEFTGSHPISLSEYYGSDTVPSSGAISLNDFYGTSNWTPGSQTFTSSGTFTPPAGTNTSTVFTVTLVAGGGGVEAAVAT